MWFMRFPIDVVYADQRGARSEARPRHPAVAHVGVPRREGRARAPGRRDRPGRRRGRRPPRHRAHVIELELTPPRPYRLADAVGGRDPTRRSRRRRARAGAAHRGRPRPGAGLAAPRRDARRPPQRPRRRGGASTGCGSSSRPTSTTRRFSRWRERRPAAGAARPAPSRAAARRAARPSPSRSSARWPASSFRRSRPPGSSAGCSARSRDGMTACASRPAATSFARLSAGDGDAAAASRRVARPRSTRLARTLDPPIGSTAHPTEAVLRRLMAEPGDRPVGGGRHLRPGAGAGRRRARRATSA